MNILNINKIGLRCLILSLFVFGIIFTANAQIQVITDCNTGVADLTGYTATNDAPEKTLTFHSGTPATDANKLTAAQLAAMTPGTYYAAFYDPIEMCYSGEGNAVTKVEVAACVKADCETNQIDLSNLYTATNINPNKELTFHSASPANDANKLSPAQLTTATPGTYYAAFYDSTNMCYSSLNNNGDGTATTTIYVAECIKNICPDTIVDLDNRLSVTNGNTDKQLTFHSAAPASDANKLSQIQIDSATAGTYYAAFYDPTNMCYGTLDGLESGSAVTPIVVEIETCTVLAKNDIAQTPQGTPVTGQLLTNDDRVVKVTEITVNGVTTPVPNNGSTAAIQVAGTDEQGNTVSNAGTITVNSDGTYTFVPTGDFSGSINPITYTASDGVSGIDTALLDIDVISSIAKTNNNKPVANDDTNIVEQNATVTTNVLANDNDPDGDMLSIVAGSVTNNGTAISTDMNMPTAVYAADGTTQAGTAYLDAQGNIVFTANATYTGDVVFNYEAKDPSNAKDDAILTVTIQEVNTDNETFANDDAALTEQGVSTAGNVLTNDFDPEGNGIAVDSITVLNALGNKVTVVAGTTIDVYAVNPNNAAQFIKAGAITVNSDGSYNYNPEPTFVGTASVEYKTIDGGAAVTNNPATTPASDSSTLSLTTLPIDSDGDGIADNIDLDDDNDGIKDTEETDAAGNNPLADADGDGIPAYLDDNDTDATIGNVNGVVEPSFDPDGDGIPSHLDLDSDNDGIPDIVEAGGTDTDGDGRVDYPTAGDPTSMPDTNSNGLYDPLDSTNGGTDLPSTDTDGDGIPNTIDLDSDNDGILDIVEAGGTDTDGDGRVDYPTAGDPTSMPDTDKDGLSDVVDGDVSGGTPLLPTGADSDNDGRPNSYPNHNTDNSGLPNPYDIDADDDGIPDNIEAQPTLGYVAPTEMDSDNDGIDDAYDKDAAGSTPIPVPQNTDGTDAPDYLDADTDNDGILDIVENGSTTNVLSGTDSDGDGLDDAFDSVPTPPGGRVDVNDNIDIPNAATLGDEDGDLNNGGDVDYRDPIDSDGDGIADNIDLDDDNDGILDTVENASGCGTTVSATGTDMDCDGDGIPNRLDLDSDGDGITDVVEAGGTDTDGDGRADDTDGDTTNNDGIPSTAGTGLTPPNTDNADGANPYDVDSDKDGIEDKIEGHDNNPPMPTGTDTDNDGIDDAYDPDCAVAADCGGTIGQPATTPNTDNHELPDYLDTDSDNDGLLDMVEGLNDTNANGIPDFRDIDCALCRMEYAFKDGIGNQTTSYAYNPSTMLLEETNSTDGIIRINKYCEISGWRYYYNPAAPTQALFALRGTAAELDKLDYIEIRVDAQSDAMREADSADSYTRLMGRDWYVKLTTPLTAGEQVDVRFYYPEQEFGVNGYQKADSRGTPNGTPTVTWFKADSWSAFNPNNVMADASNIRVDGVMTNYTELTPQVTANTTTGVSETDVTTVGNNKNFVQFNNLDGFSGGTAMFEKVTAPLSVSLLSFEGRTEDCSVSLSWVSVKEENFSHYEVEWSNDGYHYESIGKVAGTISLDDLEKNYRYTHSTSSNSNYYRLRLVDNDNSFVYSEIISLTADCGVKPVSIYPNPLGGGNNELNVHFYSTTPTTNLIIRDLFGRVVGHYKQVASTNDWYTSSLDVSELPSGTYNLQIEGQEEIKVFVITD